MYVCMTLESSFLYIKRAGYAKLTSNIHEQKLIILTVIKLIKSL